jgi:hypothetical protein
VEGDEVDFRITYAGPLLPSTNNNPRADHKQELRKHFHPQLRRLWEVFPHLKEMEHPLPDNVITVNAPPAPKRVEYLANRFQRDGYRFVPLVTKDLVLACAVNILFLRPDPPGKIIKSGDLDNRIKTLFDGLKMPEQKQDLGKYVTPGPGEDPFFCLVEDDSLITSLSVDTDIMLEPVGIPQRRDARLIVTITLRPSRLTWANMGFA